MDGIKSIRSRPTNSRIERSIEDLSPENENTNDRHDAEIHPPPEGPPPEAQPLRRSTLVIGGLVILVIIIVIVITGVIPRVHARKELRKETDELAPPTVSVTHPTQASPSQEIVLPSNTQAFIEAPIYARTSGYLKSWNFDIGSKVKKGQLLAVVEAPEVDQQLAQAKADLQTTLANAHLASVTADRYSNLIKSDSVSQQETDNAVQNSAAQNQTVKSQEANVQRLQQLVDYEKIYAPFDGVITQRNTDIGQLINAGNGGAPALLFNEADIRKIRVFVNVPQEYTQEMRIGSPAYLVLPELPEKKFYGNIARTASAIDPSSRTLNVEVDMDNKTGDLLPGAYAEVHFPVKAPRSTFLLPVGALIFRSEGLQVAKVVSDNRAQLVHVVAGRDYGNQIEIISGLSPNDEIMTNPPDSVLDGVVVHVAKAADGQSTQTNAGASPAGQSKSPGQGDSGQSNSGHDSGSPSKGNK
jgi:RND family efflux transporter MFP subunit